MPVRGPAGHTLPLVRNLSRILKALAACQSGLRGLQRPGTFKLIEVTGMAHDVARVPELPANRRHRPVDSRGGLPGRSGALKQRLFLSSPTVTIRVATNFTGSFFLCAPHFTGFQSLASSLVK